MWSHRPVNGLRAASALAVASTLLASALVSTPSARADAPVDPVARLQVVVTQAHIYNDRDLGTGEMKLTVGVHELEGAYSPKAPPLASNVYRLKGSSGQDVPLERVLPGEGDTLGDSVSVDGGVPAYPGKGYIFVAKMVELDTFSDDDMGDIAVVLNEGNGWGIGAHTIRSTRHNADGQAGDYGLVFEVRRVPLPDLKPTGLRVVDLPGSAKKLVCTAIQNAEAVDAGPFDLVLRIDGNVPPGGATSAGRLAAGRADDLCVEAELPASGQHELAAIVDEPRTVPEAVETNNVIKQAYSATPPSPPPSPAQVDLTASAIRIRGRVPDGKDDCRDGKNDVAVVVKNVGTTRAAAFDVQLTIDPVEKEGIQQHTLVESVSGLEAGKEQEVRFEDVRLKKGEHKLAAFVDVKGTVAESNESNNSRQVAAACNDDD